MSHIAQKVRPNWQEYTTISPLANQIGLLARDALVAEVMLSPKPGLVDQWNNGSHSDLTVELMVRSVTVLRLISRKWRQKGKGITLIRRRILCLICERKLVALVKRCRVANDDGDQ